MKYNLQQIALNLFRAIIKKTSIIMLFTVLLNGCSSNNNLNPNDMLPSNFYSVSDDLFRSEQPSQKEILRLDELGFKTIINLRLWHSDRDKVENTNINEVWIRIRAGNITDDKVIEILRAINTAPKPILIHCWHGSDRTGVVVAMYRLVFQNWTKSQAISELMQPEFGYHYNVYPNIIKYIENVDVESIKASIFES